MSTSENTSKNRKQLDEVRDVMMLYKEKIVAVTILSSWWLTFAQVGLSPTG